MNKKALLERRAQLLNEAQAIATDSAKIAETQAKLAEIAQIDQQIETFNQIEVLKKSQSGDAHLAAHVKRHFTMKELMNSVKTGVMSPFLAELSSEGRKQLGSIAQNSENSLLLPVEALGVLAQIASGGRNQKPSPFRNDMTSTGQTSTAGDQGGDTLDTIMLAWSDYLFNNSILSQLGAVTLTGLTANYNLTRGATTPTFAWEGEVDAAAETTPNTAKTAFNPKRVGGFIDLSVMLSIQNPSFERALANALLTGFISKWEEGAINGGGTNEPTGIIGTSGVGAVYAGGATSDGTNTAGIAQIWTDWVNLEKEVAIDNAGFGNLAYLTNTKVRASAKTIKMDSGSGNFIWMPNSQEVNGYRVGVTNNVPSTITKGGSGATLSALIFGNFNKLVLGQWGGLEVMMNPYTRMKEGIIEMFFNGYVNAAVIEPRAFAVCDDIVA